LDGPQAQGAQLGFSALSIHEKRKNALKTFVKNFVVRHFGVGRGGRAKLAISTSFLTRGGSACISLVSVPVAVRYLGNEGYGLLTVVVSVVGWIQFSNLGLGLGLQNALTEQVALDNRKAQQELVSTTFFALLAIAVLLILTVIIAFPLIDWTRVFPLPTARFAHALPRVIAVALGCFISTTMWGFIQPIYAARQELHVYNLQSLIASMAGLIGLLFAVHLQSGLVGVAISNIGITSAFTAVFGLWTIYGRGLRELYPRWSNVTAAAWRKIYRTGIGFLLLQVCAVAVFQSDAFIISRFLPVDMVTPYSVGQRAFAQLIGVLGLVTASLWPAFGNAKALGDVSWMQRTYRKLILYSMSVYAAVFFGLAIFGNTIFSLWVGKHAAPSTLLVCAIGFNYLLILWTNNYALLLNALGVIRKQVIILSVQAVVALGLNIYLVQRLGTIGMAIGGSLAYLSISVWYLPWLFRKSLSKIADTNKSTLVNSVGTAFAPQ
jgi:O-antigen/teichoic acid export membrane protein